MNKLHLPPDMQGGLVMGEAKIQLIKHAASQTVLGSAVTLPPQQTGPNEITFPVVAVGGLSKTEYFAAQLMPFYLKTHDMEYSAEQAVLAAKALESELAKPDDVQS